MMEKMENLLLKILLKWFFSQKGNEAKITKKKKEKTNNQSEKSTRKMKHCGVHPSQLELDRYGSVLKQKREEHKEEDVIVRFWNESFIEFSVDVLDAFVKSSMKISCQRMTLDSSADDDETYFLGNFLGIYFNLRFFFQIMWLKECKEF